MRTKPARQRAIIVLAAAGGLSIAATKAWADRYWVGPADGSWNNAANWSATLGGAGGAGVPVVNEFVHFQHLDAINRNIVLDVSTPNFARLRIGNSGTGVTTLIQSSNFSISSVAEFEGSTLTGTPSNGVHTQSAGLNTITWFLSLGDDPGNGTGTYNLSGTGSMILNGTAVSPPGNPGLFVGTNEGGVFNQSGGTVTVGTAVLAVPSYIGFSATGVGTYNLSAGSLLAMGNEFVGYNGIGTVNQSGGTHKVGSASLPAGLFIGYAGSGTGNYLLSGGGNLIVTDHEYIGLSGTATFTQSGGTNTVGTVAVPKDLHLGFNGTGKGTYLLSGGALNPNGDEYIGNAGAGTFNQSGGTHTFGVGHNLYLGFASTGTGTYLLSGGGVLNGYVEFVGYSGTGLFNQSGGAHTVGGMQVGGNGSSNTGTGTYLLSGSGSLHSSGGVYVGAGGTGTFIQNGGTVIADADLFVAVTFPGLTTGYYTLQNGAITVAGYELIGGDNGTGTFNQSDGQNTAGHLSIGGGPNANGNYLLGGGTLTVIAEEHLGDTGSGTMIQSGGAHLIGSVLAPTELIVGGSHNGTFLLNGAGAVTLWGNLYVALFGGGVFSQSAGTATVNGNAYISGGSLSESGPGGMLTISGGSMSITGTLKIWNNSTTSIVNLSNGYLSVGSLNTDGAPSRFNWTGGTFAITGGMNIGPGGPLSPVVNIPGTLLNKGVMTMTGGSTTGPGQFINQNTLTGYGSLGGTGSIVNNGFIQPSGGNLVVTNTAIFSNTGSIQITGAAQLQLNGGNLSNSGIIALSNATITGTAQLINNSDGLIYGQGNISSPFVNNGLLQVDAGNFNISSFTNNGIIELASTLANLRGGAIANEDIIEGFGKVTSAITNHGQIKALNGTMILAGPVTNGTSGQIVVPAGANVLVQSSPVPNNGLISLLGGTYDTNNQAMTNASTGAINGRGTLRTGGITNGGSISLSGGVSDIFGAITNNTNAKTIVTGGSTSTFYGIVTNDPGSEFRVSTGSTAVFLANVTGAGAFTGQGVKIFEAGASLGPIDTLTGSSIVSASTSLTATRVREASLEVDGTTLITPNGTSAGTSKLKVLNIAGSPGAWTGKLDLANNSLVLDYLATSPLATVKDQIRTARSGGSWLGNGITSSMADAATYALGYAENPALGFSTFSGQVVDSTSVLIKYTWYGDADLNGVVNAHDLGLLALGWQNSGDWTSGDFNYDGFIDVNDLVLLADNWQAGIGAPLGQALEEMGLPAVSMPEPTLLATFVLAAPLLLRRRRIA